MATYGFPRRNLRITPSNENEVPPLNWRRGLFRIWVVFSAAWIMGWTIYLIIFGLQGGFRQFGQVLAVPVTLFGPPIATLLLGLGVRWALQGFRGDAKKPET
jgi:hypothetical protein